MTSDEKLERNLKKGIILDKEFEYLLRLHVWDVTKRGYVRHRRGI